MLPLLRQAFPVAGIQPAVEEISSGVGKFGLGFQKLRETVRRLFVALELEQGQCAMMERPHITGSRGQGSEGARTVEKAQSEFADARKALDDAQTAINNWT